MIRFKPRGFNREDGRTPVMFDREIDDLVHTILSDYDSDLLYEPCEINVEHFLEHYLGATVQYHDIYNSDPDHPIFALTAFTEGSVKVFDREKECVSEIYVPARTVIIDNAVMEPGKEGLALFTGFHEGGHLVMHWDVFVNKDGYPYERTIDEAAVLCCRRENIESFGFGKKERTASEWREHQADYFAAAIAMPNATFRPFVNGIMRENNYYKGYIKTGIDDELDILANDLLPEYISETYGVSKRAARIKLRKAGFVGNTVKSK